MTVEALRCRICGGIYPSADQRCPSCGGDGLPIFAGFNAPRPRVENAEEVRDDTLDRMAIRKTVEDFWRSLILYGRHLGETQPNISIDEYERLSREFSRRFSARNETTAALMQPEQATAYLTIIDEEDDLCFEELRRDRDGLYRRLGLNLTSDPRPRAPIVYRRRGLGELAVRTAVRATVWEMIWSLFRR